MRDARRSRSLLINPRFQVSVIGWFAAVASMVVAVFFAGFIVFFRNMTAQAVAAGLGADHPLFRYIDAQQFQLFEVFAVASLVAIGIILIGGLWLSHRVAGPLHRMTTHLRSSRPTTVAPFTTRSGDYFPELRDAFNEFAGRRD